MKIIKVLHYNIKVTELKRISNKYSKLKSKMPVIKSIYIYTNIKNEHMIMLMKIIKVLQYS